MEKQYSRRQFARTTSLVVAGLGLAFEKVSARIPGITSGLRQGWEREPVIDIHQHVNYSGRSDDQLLTHQRAMGISTTILLPSGRPLSYGSTYYGHSNGLQANTGGNDGCHQFAARHPGEFFSAANEVPDHPDALKEIERYLQEGSPLIGEQKFGIECDAAEMQKLYALAEKYDVPVLMHWQHGMYNRGIDRFHRMLEKFSRVNFIGHAQTWWANIDRNHTDQNELYPRSKVAPGGLTDRLLSDYPNMYGDLSAGSGLNSLLRDEDHASKFLERHQDKLLFGSDCSDSVGHGTGCLGAQIIEAVRRLAPSTKVERKILHDNAYRLFRLDKRMKAIKEGTHRK